jgi:NifU-like protein
VPIYPEGLTKRLDSLASAGTCHNANALGSAAIFECGCVVRFTLKIDDENQKIECSSFTSNGCGYAVVAADLHAARLSGRHLPDLHGMDRQEFQDSIVSEVGDIPENRRTCINATFEAVKGAFNDYRSYRLEEFSGEKAVICTCFGVAEETIEAFIAVSLPKNVEDVTAACRAGGGCGSCRFLIQEMIDVAAHGHL